MSGVRCRPSASPAWRVEARAATDRIAHAAVGSAIGASIAMASRRRPGGDERICGMSLMLEHLIELGRRCLRAPLTPHVAFRPSFNANRSAVPRTTA